MGKRSRAAEAVIERGTIVIRLPIRNLRTVMQHRPGPVRAEVVNVRAFAAAVVNELNVDDESGASDVHRMFDAACERAVENGSLGAQTIKGHGA